MARDFTVFPILNGWVIKIGCWMIAYTDRDTFLSDMREYVSDPEKKEKEMVARYTPERALPESMGGVAKPKQCAAECSMEMPSDSKPLDRALRR